MDTLNFLSKIEHGLIRLPIQYEKYENAYVRVIVVLETSPNEWQEPLLSKRDKLMATFQKMKTYTMFQSIEKPFELAKTTSR